ncbi:MAG: hypothetical protein HQM13_24050 [SAR324 cluster bacterium]|nr:hypothetical protein [SAR324 cluster bacterium]
MVEPMMTFSKRRLLGISFLFFISLLLWIANELVVVSLNPSHFFTGWVLLVTLLGLTLFNVRKKLPFLPLGSASAWTQFHIYAGFFSVVSFVLHVGWKFPQGPIQVVLFALFVGVTGSGIFGLFLSRTFPALITTHGENVLFERIPVFRNKLRAELEASVLDFVDKTNSETVADFYIERLSNFFDRPRNYWHHLLQSTRPLISLLHEIEIHQRFVNSKEQEFLDLIKGMVKQKNNLDYQYALQMTLKGWLFVHIPMTYSLMIISVLHAFIAYAFYGGVS